MSVTDELLENNTAYVAAFDKGDLPLPPGKKVAVVACMDARLNVYGVLGLQEGDAHVIRNAGGVVTDDEIRSLAISQRLLGTEEIILIHHTDCGMLTFTDDEFKRADPERRRHQATVVGGGVQRPGRGRAPVDRPDQGQPVHPPQGQRPRLRLRRHHRHAQRSELVQGHKRELAISAPSASAASFAHATSGSIPCRPTWTLNPQSTPAMTRSRPTSRA